MDVLRAYHQPYASAAPTPQTYIAIRVILPVLSTLTPRRTYA
jgi:hypothetical protein